MKCSWILVQSISRQLIIPSSNGSVWFLHGFDGSCNWGIGTKDLLPRGRGPVGRVVDHGSGNLSWVKSMSSLVISATLTLSSVSHLLTLSVCQLVPSPRNSPAAMQGSAWNPSIPLGFVSILLLNVCPEQVKYRIIVLNLSSSLSQTKKKKNSRPREGQVP